MITIDNVSVKYKKTVLTGVNIQAQSGECIGLLGLNGSGKSTLLSAIAGIKKPASGKINAEGKIGFVTQENALIDELTAYDNILMWTSMKKDDIMNALKGPELSILKVSDFINVKVRNMSGGMKKRLALASVIITGPDILLMDEPFSAIDAKNRVILQELLLKLWEGDGTEPRKTVVFVTHDIDEAILLSDKIVVLTAHPGTVNEIVRVPFERPRNREQLVKTDEYGKFRNKLLSLLYNDIAERIGGDEVVL